VKLHKFRFFKLYSSMNGSLEKLISCMSCVGYTTMYTTHDMQEIDFSKELFMLELKKKKQNLCKFTADLNKLKSEPCASNCASYFTRTFSRILCRDVHNKQEIQFSREPFMLEQKTKKQNLCKFTTDPNKIFPDSSARNLESYCTRVFSRILCREIKTMRKSRDNSFIVNGYYISIAKTNYNTHFNQFIQL
jgi:hypothetical protein